MGYFWTALTTAVKAARRDTLKSIAAVAGVGSVVLGLIFAGAEARNVHYRKHPPVVHEHVTVDGHTYTNTIKNDKTKGLIVQDGKIVVNGLVYEVDPKTGVLSEVATSTPASTTLTASR